jgi:maleate isomerase
MKHIALIIPHTDITLESDLQRFLPDECILHTQRIWLDEVGEEAEKRMVDVNLPESLPYLKGITSYDAVVFGCTSASAVYGKTGLKRLEGMLSESFDCPSISAFGAVLSALEDFNSKSIGLITPYSEEVNAMMVRSLSDFGITTTFHKGWGLIDDRDISKVEPDDILDWIMEFEDELMDKVDTLFISCTNFRSMENIGKIEAMTGKRVVTSNASITQWIEQL